MSGIFFNNRIRIKLQNQTMSDNNTRRNLIFFQSRLYAPSIKIYRIFSDAIARFPECSFLFPYIERTRIWCKPHSGKQVSIKLQKRNGMLKCTNNMIYIKNPLFFYGFKLLSSQSQLILNVPAITLTDPKSCPYSK